MNMVSAPFSNATHKIRMAKAVYKRGLQKTGIFFVAILVCSEVYALQNPPLTKWRDEGVDQGQARVVDITGSGGSVSVSGGVATVTVTGGAPGGSDTQVQFNASGSFSADSGLTFINSSNNLIVSGDVLGANGRFADAYVNTEVYDATAWNGNLTVPTKDALRDKIESMVLTSPFTTASNVTYLTTTTDNMTVGSSSNLGKIGIDGDTDEIQLLVQGNATQNQPLLTVEKSDGTDLFRVSNDGTTTIGGTATEGMTLGSGAQATYVVTSNLSGATDPTLTFSNNATTTSHNLGVSGDVTILGDNITATTNTDKFVFIANGTTYGPRQLVTSDVVTTGVWPASMGGTGHATHSKGDLFVATASGVITKLTVGANGTVLSADSSTASGVKWETPPVGAGGSPGGANFQIQYNNASSFGGATMVTTDALRVAVGPGTSRAVSLDVAGNFRTVPVATADAATIQPDANRSNFGTVVLTGQPRTLIAPVGGEIGQKYTLIISQDATGSRKIGIGAGLKFGSSITTFDASTTAGSRDYIGLIKASTVTWDIVAVSQGYR